jgi:acyl-CoA thioester hydrolase
MKHVLPCRVYYENTDAGGIVYHGQYLNFAERGRTEFLREIGHQSSDLTKTLGIMFVARYLDINYFSPAFLDDLLEVHTSIAELKNSSFTMRQTFIRKNDKEAVEKIAELMVTLVTVEADSIKPVRVPEDLRRKFVEYIEG